MSIPNYKYGIEPKRLKKIRALIMHDIMHENYVENAIPVMTVRKYCEIIKEAVLGCCDENGCVISWFDNNSSKYAQNMHEIDAIEVARMWMDGRGLFTPHFNSQLMADEHHYGNWENIDQHEQNQWYHPDRLDDPAWFMECYHVIGHAGHPTEGLLFGNLNPVYHKYSDCWTLSFGLFSRCDFYTLRAYKYMRKKHLPVYIYAGQNYLTDKQKLMLWPLGYLQKHDFETGYYLSEPEITRLSKYGYKMEDWIH